MKRLLTTTAIVVGAFYFGAPAMAVPTVQFCGPTSEGGNCESGNEAKVYLQQAKGVTTGYGNIGSQTGLPIMQLVSDGGTFNSTPAIDLGNGFANITADTGKVFNGLDITILGDAAHPYGYGFTELVFDVQLGGNLTNETFTADAYSGAQVLDLPEGNGSDKHDQDAEYVLTAIGGVFDEVNIFTTSDGFKEVKHIEVDGVCAFTDASRTTCDPVVIQTPEPASIALLGVGLLGLGYTAARRRS